MKIRVSIMGEGASLAIKSNLQPTYFSLQSGEHEIDLGEGEVLVMHDARRDPNFPTATEEVQNLPPGIVAVGAPFGNVLQPDGTIPDETVQAPPTVTHEPA